MNNINYFLFASPGDSGKILKITRNCTFFTYSINPENGLLGKKNPPMGSNSRLMYLSDYGISGQEIDSQRLSRDIWAECQSRRMGGVFFDFDNSQNRQLLFELCQHISRFGLTSFLPIAMKACVPQKNWKLVLPSAISGGSFEQMLAEAAEQYGSQNLCLDIVPACQDFTMPSYAAVGTTLTKPQFEELMAARTPTPFFSKELCAMYFTYRHDDSSSHFVLYDNTSTAASKIETARRLNLYGVFLLYNDFGDSISSIIGKPNSSHL